MRALTLAVESSLFSVGVALGSRTGKIDSIEASGTASPLPLLAIELLQRGGYSPRDVEAVVAGTGPGSYTGMRVATAFALGLARGLGIQAVGIPSFDAWAEALAQGGATGPLAVVRDARRGRVYWAPYALENGRAQRTGPFATDELSALARHFNGPFLAAGEAWDSLAEPLLALGALRAASPGAPPAAQLIELYWKGHATPPRPLYLKATEAEEKFGSVQVDPSTGHVAGRATEDLTDKS